MIRLAIIVLFVSLSASSLFAGTWRDDFEDGNASLASWEWFALWELEDGEYSLDYFNLPQNIINTTLMGNAIWEDYTVKCKMKYISKPSGWTGVMFRHTDQARYGFHINADSNTADGWKAIEPAVTQLSNDPLRFTLSKDIWYELKVVVKGNNFKFYLDEKPAGEFNDKSIQSGKVGFYVRNVHAHFDDFIISGDDVKDGGNWDPAKHPGEKAIEPKSKLATAWGKIKYN